MTKIIMQIILISSLLSLLSCSHQVDKKLLSDAESIIESHPDSALSLLNQITHPEKNGTNFHMNYLLLLTRAKDKNDVSIENDTIIFSTIPYFQDRSEDKKTAMAYFYAGRVYAENGDDQKAIKAFADATSYADKMQDYDLLGLIHYYEGNLYMNQLYLENALHSFTLSKNYFNKAGDTKNEYYAYLLVACCHFNQERFTTALNELSEILLYAEKSQDSMLKSDVLKWTARIYLKKNALIQAKDYILSSIEIKTSPQDMSYKYIILSDLYQRLGQIDSFNYYVALNEMSIQQSDDQILKAKYYFSKMNESENKKNYKEALKNYKLYIQYSELIETSNREESIIEIKEKYKTEKIENEHNRIIIQRQYLIIGLFVLLFLICLFIGIGRHHRIKINNKLLQIESMNFTLKRLLSDTNNNEEKLKKLLIEKLDVAKKMALINTMSANEKLSLSKVNEIFYGKNENPFDWDEFSNLLNDIYDNFVFKLEKQCPDLNENEMQFCGLLKAGLDSSEIALLLNFSPTTIRIRKSNIRKKLKIENGGDVAIFVEDLLKKVT